MFYRSNARGLFLQNGSFSCTKNTRLFSGGFVQMRFLDVIFGSCAFLIASAHHGLLFILREIAKIGVHFVMIHIRFQIKTQFK